MGAMGATDICFGCNTPTTGFTMKSHPLVGDWGEYAAVKLQVKGKKFMPHIAKFGSKVTTELHLVDGTGKSTATENTLGVTSFTTEAFTGNFGTWEDFEKVAEATNIPDATLVDTTAFTCDTAKWASATAC